jgi:hypothetical protein
MNFSNTHTIINLIFKYKLSIKIKLLLIVFVCNTNLFSQSKELFILDSITKQPIDLVQVYYPSLSIGSITNKDGRLIIPKKTETLIISHINYNQKKILPYNLINIDTLYLEQRKNVLDEVIIYNYDLKKKLKDVLITYKDNYSIKNIINYTTYKETNRVNDSLVRLFQLQLSWWSKNYIFDFNSKIEKNNRLYLNNIDYSEISKDSPFTEKGATLGIKDFLKFCHLNFLLTIIIQNTDDIVINTINKENGYVKVNFDGTLKENGKSVYNFKNSYIIFNDNKIEFINLKMYYDQNQYKSVSRNGKIPYKSLINSHEIILSFQKNLNNKLTIGYFTSILDGQISIEGNESKKIKVSQNLLINKTLSGKKLKIKEINLNTPLYLSLSKDLKRNLKAKFLLTKEEEEFIKSDLND